jgi:acetolactate synthase-1/2/3 large subunit
MVDEIRRLMPADGILALDNGMYKIWFARNYPANLPNTILLDNALAAMGAGLPSAIVAKMVHPERKIMAICGDGGFMMNSQELITAVQLKLDMVIVILCDNAFGMVKWKQKEMNLNDYGLDFTCPDFVKYAEACGATGHWAGSAPKFAAIVEEVLNMGGVHLIEVPIDYTDNHRILNQEIKELSEQL